jgi:hypothetical protein
LNLDICSATLEISSGDITISPVIARSCQDDHSFAICCPGANRSKCHRKPGALHRSVEVALVGLVDAPIFVRGENGLHSRRLMPS